MSKNSGLGPIKFPLDTHDQVKSKISFQAIRVDPPQIDIDLEKSETHKDIQSGPSNRATAIGQAAVDLLPESVQNFMRAGTEGTMKAAQKIIPLRSEKVDLYLPIAFQVNDMLQYDQASLGTIGGAVAAGMQSGQGVMSGIGQGIDRAGNSIFEFFKSGAFAGEASRIGAASLARVLPQGIGSAINISARITINPNLRTKFNGVNIREFTFQFKFIPKSGRESAAVKDLVKFFRFHAYPEEIPGKGAFSIALDYPNMFKIRLLSNVNGKFRHVGTPIKYCYLRNISAVYNPTTPVLHADGAPTEVDLNLSFTEYKPLSREDIMNEDNDIRFDAENQNIPGEILNEIRKTTQGPQDQIDEAERIRGTG